MKAADGFASIPYPEVGKFILFYSTFQVKVFKLPLRSVVYWVLLKTGSLDNAIREFSLA